MCSRSIVRGPGACSTAARFVGFAIVATTLRCEWRSSFKNSCGPSREGRLRRAGHIKPMRDGIRRSCAAMLALVGSVAASGAYTGAQESGNTEFERIARSFFYAGFAESPSSATANGVHAYDAKIDDVSASATLAHFAREKKTLAAVQAIDPATLSADDALDRTMLLDSIEDDLLVNERAATWRHDPDLYVSIASDAIYGLIERDFAPISVRLRDTIAREQQLARLFAQARA